MMETELFVQLAYAIGVGLLIGLERSLGQVRPADGADLTGAEPPGPDPPGPDQQQAEAEFLGVRTFSVLSVVGFTAALASERFPGVAPVLLGGICVLVVAMYWRFTTAGVGITTEIAAIGACGLGMLCRVHAPAAGVIALVLTVILASKRFTHSTVRRMRRVELTDTLKFLVVILIILPLLPNRALDPYGAFNPHKVGLLVVLISGISFVGYFLTRILGAQRGLGLTGVLGGLTSSTAVTAAMARQARETPALGAICAFSTLVANATMFGRVLVVVALLDRALVMRLLWSVGGMAVVATLCAAVLWFRAGKAKGGGAAQVKLKNPFSVGPALKFAAFFVMILFVAKLAKAWLGDSGLYLAAGFSGLADVDAITLSIAESTGQGSLAHGVGAIGVTIAVVSNSVVKSAIAVSTGGWRYGRSVAACLGLATLVGLAMAFLVA